MHDTITGPVFQEMLIFGAASIAKEKQSINDLNVFPVPDGDTGTNMSLTMHAAAQELQKRSPATVDLASSITASALLRGARGNSGVILSLLFRGMSKSLKGCVTADGCTFAAAMQEGVSAAYNAVMKPAEGTILTVSRLAADRAMAASAEKNSVEYVIEQAIAQGEETLRQTVDMNPVLKKAGVVDAGGKGLMCLYEGMYKALIGEEVGGNITVSEPKSSSETLMDHADIMNLGVIEFAYCTEFFIININKKTTLADIEKLREKLMALGDCVIVIGDLELVKVHVHTNKPGVALSYALELGELDKVKIENMLEQNRELKKKYEAEKKDMAMLAVSVGEGISDIFRDLTVDGIIEGGQSMNPSASSIADAAQRINADTIFVLPNNKNIILAAEQAKSLVEGKTIHVIPTKNIPQGFSAALAFNPEVSAEENKANMIHALDNVTAGQVTYAVRTTKIDGFSLKEGDIIGLDNKKILAKGDNVKKVVIDLVAKLKSMSDEIITLYYGEDVKEEDAAEIQAELQELYPECDVEINYGGQPIYYYMIALE